MRSLNYSEMGMDPQEDRKPTFDRSHEAIFKKIRKEKIMSTIFGILTLVFFVLFCIALIKEAI